jgi:hypothetical protein
LSQLHVELIADKQQSQNKAIENLRGLTTGYRRFESNSVSPYEYDEIDKDRYEWIFELIRCAQKRQCAQIEIHTSEFHLSAPFPEETDTAYAVLSVANFLIKQRQSPTAKELGYSLLKFVRAKSEI